MSSPAPWADARTRIQNAAFGIPIEWANEPFDVPAGVMWMSVDAVGDSLLPIELGPTGTWSEEGSLFVTIMAPQGSGTYEQRVLAKSVANLFRGIPSGPIIYRRASIGIGRQLQRDGMWWAMTVQIEWSYTDK